MSNGKHSALFELLSNCFLYDSIGIVVNIGRRFIDYQYFRLLQYSSRQANKLLLANTQVSAAARDGSVQTACHRLNIRFQANRLERAPNIGFAITVERI
jgi:hypothetical protein